MKRILLFLFILAFCSGLAISLIFAPKTSTKPKTDLKLPNLTLKTDTGQKINFSKDINNKTILLFWLPKSNSCQKQLQILEETKTKLQKEIKVYGVSIGNIPSDELNKIKKENSITYPLVIDREAKLSEKLLISAIPTMIFINSEGTIVEEHVGLMNKEDLERTINSMTQ